MKLLKVRFLNFFFFKVINEMLMFFEDNVIFKSKNDDLNEFYREEFKLLEILLFWDFMSSWIYY